MTDPLLMAADSECTGTGDDKISSGTKRPVSESNTKSPIVYVRRKTEATKTKTNVCATQIDPMKKSTTDQMETTSEQVTQDDAPPTTQQVTQDVASPPRRASSPSFSSTRRSVSPSLGHIASSEENIHVGSSNPPSSEEANTYWEDRYSRLQSLLKKLDQSDRHDYVQMLYSMSSVELSRHAVELEERSFRLSMAEARELERGELYDLLGKYGKNARKASSQQEQLQKQGNS